jgi:NADPH:quinone reductase
MLAVTVVKGDLRWQRRPDPVAGDTELLVAVRAAGVNMADLNQRRGLYPEQHLETLDIPGLEFAGEVIGVGRQVTRFQVGDRVMAIVSGGAQATLAVVDEVHALPVPSTLSWAEAGGFPEAYSTAYDALWSQAGLTLGERVLVTGASGGVGTAGLQLAAAMGANVVASTRTAAHRERLRQLGAQGVIDPRAIADNGPYDVVLELVGAASLPSALGALADEGRVVVIGGVGGTEVVVDFLGLMRCRGRISASTLRHRDRHGKGEVVLGVARHVLPALAAGHLQVQVSSTFSMRDASVAYDHFASTGKLGKIVLLT